MVQYYYNTFTIVGTINLAKIKGIKDFRILPKSKNKEKDKKSYCHPAMGDRRIVKLNVGGMFYTTTRDTLLSQPDTLFTEILSKDSNWPRDERGSYFIDRDGHLFRYVLNFMRTSKLLLPNGFRELLMLREEASYFEIDNLMRRIDSLDQNRRRNFKPRRKKSFHSSLEVLNLNRTDFELIGDGEWWED